VIFLQYEIGSTQASARVDRFMAAWQFEKSPRDTQADTPYTMVDSGQAISWGERDYQREYRTMIDDELPRPPSALVYAHREMPSPSTIDVKVQVTNLSTTTLQTAINGAMLHIVVFEGTKALKTGSDIYATRQATFDEPLVRGDTRQFDFSFTGLRGVNLARTDVLAMVDYQPPWEYGRWDMMQAAIAVGADLPAVPSPYPTVTPTPTETSPPSPTPTDLPTETPQPTSALTSFRLFLPCARHGAAPVR
jgi:hypothetical protein